MLPCLQLFSAGLRVNSQTTVVGDTAPHSQDLQLFISQSLATHFHFILGRKANLFTAFREIIEN